MFKIAALISGSGSNLQALIDAVEGGRLNARIHAVVADRPAYGLDRAHSHNIPAIQLDRKTLGKSLSMEVDKNIPEDTDLIVLVGYLSILSSEFIEKWKGKIINIHPALLPDFGGKGMYGMNVHKAVIKAGRKESGCTVHYVDSGVDTGEIIMQKRVEVLEQDSPEDLQKRILEQEHKLIVEAVDFIIKNKK